MQHSLFSRCALMIILCWVAVLHSIFNFFEFVPTSQKNSNWLKHHKARQSHNPKKRARFPHTHTRKKKKINLRAHIWD